MARASNTYRCNTRSATFQQGRIRREVLRNDREYRAFVAAQALKETVAKERAEFEALLESETRRCEIEEREEIEAAEVVVTKPKRTRKVAVIDTDGEVPVKAPRKRAPKKVEEAVAA